MNFTADYDPQQDNFCCGFQVLNSTFTLQLLVSASLPQESCGSEHSAFRSLALNFHTPGLPDKPEFWDYSTQVTVCFCNVCLYIAPTYLVEYMYPSSSTCTMEHKLDVTHIQKKVLPKIKFV
ncbi:hypothetical protein GDO81_018255 [Engystomops pustulosus]|uniref:Uncharacterized protein n=1 Tax=Engystomops pustulosus TaxID=76066 RepID=A0AAV7A842_ENGPU|nr:hypothetical protein GDO81_018255 [Engystomops pustulosus]